MFFVLINLYINIRIYLVDAKFFVKRRDLLFAIFGRNGYFENWCVFVGGYTYIRDRPRRVCSS